MKNIRNVTQYRPQALFIKNIWQIICFMDNMENHKRGNTISAAGALHKTSCTTNHVFYEKPLSNKT